MGKASWQPFQPYISGILSQAFNMTVLLHIWNLAIGWLKIAIYPSALEFVSTVFLPCSSLDQSILHKKQY